MIKAKRKELLKMAEFSDRKNFIDYLKNNKLKVVGNYPEIVAYCESVYGLGGYLLLYVLDNYKTIKCFTGRSLWLYTCQNTKELGKEFYK